MANTVIGSSIVIDGEITGDEDLVVLGYRFAVPEPRGA